MPAPSITHIKPRSGLAGLDLPGIWAHRELLFFLAWRDIKVRYSQTLLGMGWAVLQPAATVAVLTLIFSRVPSLRPEGVPYTLFALCGLVPWLFFASTVLAGTNSLVVSSNLVTKVYFPRLLVPAAAVVAGIPDLVLSCVLLLSMMAWYRLSPDSSLLLFPAAVALLLSAALGVVLWSSTLTVRYRDFRHALPFVLQLGFFVTPVIYPLDTAAGTWRRILVLNPLTGVVEMWRASLLGQPVSAAVGALSAGMIICLLVSGIVAFRVLERDLADVI